MHYTWVKEKGHDFMCSQKLHSKCKKEILQQSI